MNQATRQINGIAAYDIQQKYLQNVYAICKQKYGNDCLTEKTYGDERMVTLHMNEEQFLKVISATPMPLGAKKQIRIKSNNSSGVGGGDDVIDVVEFTNQAEQLRLGRSVAGLGRDRAGRRGIDHAHGLGALLLGLGVGVI